MADAISGRFAAFDAFAFRVGTTIIERHNPVHSVGRRVATTRGDFMTLKRGEIAGLWVWIGVAWLILAWVNQDFLWFRPLMRQVFY